VILLLKFLTSPRFFRRKRALTERRNSVRQARSENKKGPEEMIRAFLASTLVQRASETLALRRSLDGESDFNRMGFAAAGAGYGDGMGSSGGAASDFDRHNRRA
jgi:hypothetical protein